MGSDRSTEKDAGAVIVIVAAAMGAIVMMIALVLDLSGARRDRDADQTAADAMALAGAASLGGSDSTAVAACRAAWGYLVVNLPTSEMAPAPSCSTFSAACAPTVARELVVNVRNHRITITHPVPDHLHALLHDQSSLANDGRPCDRIGIRVQQTRDNLWAAGAVELDVHAVGRLVRGAGDVQAPLVLLSEHACSVLTVSGSSALTVGTASGEPGYIAIDTDGSECSNPNKVVFDLNGQGTVTAGQIAMWALADGDLTSAYSADLLYPEPVASSAPVGRNGMDWRYNCSDANGCPFDEPAHIDDMVAAWGGSGMPSPLGTFTRWTASGRSCALSGATVVPAGQWYLDCGTAGLSTSGSLTFQGGDIVSDGPIKATGSAGLRVNCSDADPSDDVAPATCPMDPPSATTMLLRSGDLLDAGKMELRETTVHLKAGTLRLSGNHTVTWTAPDDPSHRFDDLMLWTTSTAQMKVTGSTSLHLEGILFAPNANVELAGNTGAEALGAQIFARSASLVGGAQLRLVPDEDRILAVGKGHPLLIR